jgi:SAM-dependent methyltransferase
MSNDVLDLRSFYASPLGHVARRFVGRAISQLWPSSAGMRVVGVGYASPYLALMREEAERVLAFMPARQGAVHWPAGAPCCAALVEPSLLPLDDASVDRVMLAHAIEMTDNAEELLEECWRVLAPGGRLLVIAPNRRGLWARMDGNPFGHGRPFSRRQLETVMRATMFSPESWAEALYVPPLQRRFLMRSAAAWERLGAGMGLPVAGVHVIDATKQFYRRAPASGRRAFALRQVLGVLPQPTPAAGREASALTGQAGPAT